MKNMRKVVSELTFLINWNKVRNLIVYRCYPKECIRQDIKAILYKLGVIGGHNI